MTGRAKPTIHKKRKSIDNSYAEAMGNAQKNRTSLADKPRGERSYAAAMGYAQRNRKSLADEPKQKVERERESKRRKNPNRSGKVTRYLAESRLPDGRTTLRRAKM